LHRACSTIGFAIPVLTSLGALGVFGERDAAGTADPQIVWIPFDGYPWALFFKVKLQQTEKQKPPV